MRAARFSALSEAVVARCSAETREQLRATRPGRQSRRLFALALERAVVERPGVPNVAVQAKLNRALVALARKP